MSTKVKVIKEQAESEIMAWLDKKKIFKAVREASQLEIEILIEAVSDGTITIDDKGSITHFLCFPIKDTISIQYKPRLNDNMLRPHLNGVSPRDGDGRLLAYAAALTDMPKGILSELDAVDKKVMMGIVGFFV